MCVCPTEIFIINVCEHSVDAFDALQSRKAAALNQKITLRGKRDITDTISSKSGVSSGPDERASHLTASSSSSAHQIISGAAILLHDRGVSSCFNLGWLAGWPHLYLGGGRIPDVMYDWMSGVI